jgi:macrolide-specific efflux system membrane fusion protein
VADAELQVAQAEAALAEQEDTTGLQQAVDRAEIQVAQAEANLAAVQLKLDDLLNWEAEESAVKLAEANLAAAQADYQEVVARAEHTDDETTAARVALEQAIVALQEAQAYYVEVIDAARDFDRDIDDIREAAAKNLEQAQGDLEIAQANYDLATIDTATSNVQNAWAKVVNAQVTLDQAQTGPGESEVEAARIDVQQAELLLAQAKLDLAAAQEDLTKVDTTQAELTLAQAQLQLEATQRTLEETSLIATMDGTIVQVAAVPGEIVSAGPLVTLIDLGTPLIKFWVEESDLDSVAPGNAVNVVFEALSGTTYSGQIVRVDPVLVTLDGTPAVQAWASIDLAAPIDLLSDMNAEIEIVAGEATNALLVPVQALRETEQDQYTVFVVQSNGELELRPVEVGLMDYVYAEILSGLERGEVVSVGESATADRPIKSGEPSSGQLPGGDLGRGGG